MARMVVQDMKSLGYGMKIASVGKRGREVSEVSLAWVRLGNQQCELS